MKEFENLAGGGVRLAALLQGRAPTWFDPVLLPVLPNGVPVMRGIRQTLALPFVAVEVMRSDEGVTVLPPEGVQGRTAIVLDDGVETGTVARAVAPVLRAAGVARLVLAVPVCPREASAHLDLLYDEVIAVVRPLARRSLAWHYEEFDTIDEPEARRMLGERPA